MNLCPELMPTFSPLPTVMIRGEGVWLYDDRGDQYLDAATGVAVTALGHAHPRITQAIQDQAAKLLHAGNGCHNQPQIDLAKKLTQLTGLDAAFFCSSGAEANEAAIKLCRLWGHQRDNSQPSIIVMDNAFHGRTIATLTASGIRSIQAGFEPLLSGFIRARFNDIDALHTIAHNNQHVVAVMLEVIQGYAGVKMPDPGYLAALREVCDQHDWLLVIDEVQTGIGRTGKMFAYEHAGIQPDILTMAKSLGNGFPIGACLAKQKVNCFTPGVHGSTNGGNPLAARVGLTVLETILDDNILENVISLGNILQTELQRMCQPWLESGEIINIRGQGCILGIEFAKPCPELRMLAYAEKLLINITKNKVIRLLPALTMTEDEAHEMLTRLERCLQQFFA